ncbi:MAG: hypothetical protein AAFR38_08995 [Planctomycetota bacterium]
MIRTTALTTALFAGTAFAQSPNPLFSISSSNNNGDSSLSSNDMNGSIVSEIDFLQWTLDAPVEFENGAILESATIIITGGSNQQETNGSGSSNFTTNPSVSLAFAVSAGNLDTSFTISSATNFFSTINPASALASASVTTTQDPVGLGTATTTGNFASGDIYSAFINGSLFADLVAGTLSTSTGITGTEDSNGGVFFGVGSASSISSQFSFTLTANDLASGTSSFVIIPAPGAAAGLAMAGLFAARRRR